MVAAATSAANHTDKNDTRRPWSPGDNDHLIFQWVKMQGKSQDSVASMLGISQPTVSRVIQRYERWQAHAREREGGRLDHTERLRAQRWLTYERNEVLLSSCLRIAGEMEGFTDISKSTIRRGVRSTQETEVSTQHAMLDRSGVAARFLRLAFRINMEQLKLAELDPPPPAEPLSADELAAQDRDAAAAAQEFADAQRRASESLEESSRHAPRAVAPQKPLEVDEQHPSANSPAEGENASGSQAPAWEPPTPRLQPRPQLRDAAPIDEPTPPATSLNNVNNVNNANATQINATPTDPCSCASPPRARKKSPAPCIPDNGPSPWPDTEPPKRAQRRTAAAKNQAAGSRRTKSRSACAS